MNINMNKLKKIIDLAKKEIFVEEFQNKVSDAETLGILVSQFCKWNGKDIFKVAYNAFEDSNFHSFNEKFEKLWLKNEEHKYE